MHIIEHYPERYMIHNHIPLLFTLCDDVVVDKKIRKILNNISKHTQPANNEQKMWDPDQSPNRKYALSVNCQRLPVVKLYPLFTPLIPVTHGRLRANQSLAHIIPFYFC